MARRWDPCVAHRGADAEAFIAGYFNDKARQVLLVAGAGFDPRSTRVPRLVAAAGAPLRALLLQETRANPATALSDRAEANLSQLRTALSDHQLMPVDIFGADGAVVGGRNVVSLLAGAQFEGVTDVIVDVSALSVGTSFPIIRYLFERAARAAGRLNVHVFVTHDPKLDAKIRAVPCDAPSYVHGFKGRSTLDSFANAARLWLPQLASGRRGALGHLFEFVSPHDTCPILPFPASNPRLGDELAEEYLQEFESSWAVDTRNIVYADESDPLDLYRTILRLDDLRMPVFKEVGGSMLVLSPLGSKVMALGALMAALERDLPVAYLEAMAYDLAESAPTESESSDLVHLWLEGDVYPQPRPALFGEGEQAA